MNLSFFIFIFQCVCTMVLILDYNAENVACVWSKTGCFCYCRTKQMPWADQIADFAQQNRTYFWVTTYTTMVYYGLCMFTW